MNHHTVGTLRRFSNDSSTSNASSRQERVPETLQAVFLASNRGKEVHRPPPDRVANKTYFRNWLFQRQSSAPLVSKKRKLKRRQFLFGASQPIVHTYPSGSNHSDGTEATSTSTATAKSYKREDTCTSSTSSPPLSPKQKMSAGIRAAGLRKRLSRNNVSSNPASNKSCAVPSAPPTATPRSLVPVQMSPQGYLDSLLRTRGYSTLKYKVLETAYYNKPTPLQLASHHVKLMELVRASKGDELKALIQAGLSPNPCNHHGESLLHNVCRRGDYRMLGVMLRVGSSVQVSDDHGRTPLHDACWSSASSFAAVDMILQQDNRLFHMSDARGATPLAYVRPEDWTTWSKFLRSRADMYWPARNKDVEGEQPPPPLCLLGPNTRPLPDPPGALTIELAGMVAAGRLKPAEAQLLNMSMDDDSESDSDDEEEDVVVEGAEKVGDLAAKDEDNDDDDDDDDDSDYDSDDMSDDDSDLDDDLEDMIQDEEIWRMAAAMQAAAAKSARSAAPAVPPAPAAPAAPPAPAAPAAPPAPAAPAAPPAPAAPAAPPAPAAPVVPPARSIMMQAAAALALHPAEEDDNEDFDSEDDDEDDSDEDDSEDEDDEESEDEDLIASPADSGHCTKTVSTADNTEDPSMGEDVDSDDQEEEENIQQVPVVASSAVPQQVAPPSPPPPLRYGPEDLMMESGSDSDDDMFDESEIADLIQGITAPGTRSISWTSM